MRESRPRKAKLPTRSYDDRTCKCRRSCVTNEFECVVPGCDQLVCSPCMVELVDAMPSLQVHVDISRDFRICISCTQATLQPDHRKRQLNAIERMVKGGGKAGTNPVSLASGQRSKSTGSAGVAALKAQQEDVAMAEEYGADIARQELALRAVHQGTQARRAAQLLDLTNAVEDSGPATGVSVPDRERLLTMLATMSATQLEGLRARQPAPREIIEIDESWSDEGDYEDEGDDWGMVEDDLPTQENVGEQN